LQKRSGADIADEARGQILADGVSANAVLLHRWSLLLFGEKLTLADVAAATHQAAAAIRQGDRGAIEAQLAAQFSTLNAVFLSQKGAAAGERYPLIWPTMTVESIETNDDECSCLRRAARHDTDEMYVCSFSPDRSWVLTGDHGTPVQLWDVRTGGHVRTFGGHSDMVWALASRRPSGVGAR
jgi:hypothetical protein